MKETLKEEPINIKLFDYSKIKEDDEIEFIYGYYIAKLKLLRKESLYLYTTKEEALKETLYKDLISAAASYLHQIKYKIKKNETNYSKSRNLP